MTGAAARTKIEALLSRASRSETRDAVAWQLLIGGLIVAAVTLVMVVVIAQPQNRVHGILSPRHLETPAFTAAPPAPSAVDTIARLWSDLQSRAGREFLRRLIPTQSLDLWLALVVALVVGFDAGRGRGSRNLELGSLLVVGFLLFDVLRFFDVIDDPVYAHLLDWVFTAVVTASLWLAARAVWRVWRPFDRAWRPNLPTRSLVVLTLVLLTFDALIVVIREPDDAGFYTNLGGQRLRERGMFPYGDPLLSGSPGAAYGPVLFLAHVPFQWVFDAAPINRRPLDHALGPADEYFLPPLQASQLATLTFHLTAVAALIAAARRLAGDRVAWGIGALYCSSAYVTGVGGSAEMVNGLTFISHTAPPALALVAFACLGWPLLAGVFLALSIATVFYPLFFVPAWVGYYWGRRRALLLFAAGMGLAAVVVGGPVLARSRPIEGRSLIGTIVRETLGHHQGADTYGATKFGFWGARKGVRASLQRELVAGQPVTTPMFLIVAVAAALGFFPARRCTPQQLALLSAAAAILVQVWKTLGTGVYVTWYYPFLLIGWFAHGSSRSAALAAPAAVLSSSPAADAARFDVALADALLGVRPDAAKEADEHAVTQAARFLRGQIAALPVAFRIGTRLGLLAFRADVRLRRFHGFSQLARAARVGEIERWADGPIVPFRQLFRALRSLVVLDYHEEMRDRRSADPQPSPRRAGDAPARARRSVWADEDVEVLIIGSGAGGSVTAVELAARGHDVLVVEEGPPIVDATPDPGSPETIARLYRHRGMTPIVGRVPIAYVEGACVGGSTEINSGFWHRPPVETLLRWKAQYDLACASPHELRPHWEWAESVLDVRLNEIPRPPCSEHFAQGAARMDWAVSEVPRIAATARRRDLRPRSVPMTAPGPGMSRSLIPHALAAGARLESGCRVDKLLVRGSRAVGAIATRWDANGRASLLRIRADHVFVCAGPTETPSLLQRSGVTHLVGQSLRIHPMLKVAARFPDDLGIDRAAIPALQVREFWPEIILGGAYYSPGHLAVLLSDNWALNGARMKDAGSMACYYVGVRGTGRGRVWPSSLEGGRTRIGYELSHEDVWNLSRGLARLSALLLRGGAVEVLPTVRGVPSIRTEVDAVRWLDDRLDGRACSLSTVHAFSTCPIGERRDRCAADSFGKLHGFDNLFVNDASMVPDSPGVNPQGTIMSLARRNALRFCDVVDA